MTCMYIYIYIYTQSIYVYIYTMHICIYTYYLCRYVCIHVYPYIYATMYMTSIHIYGIRVCILHTEMCGCLCVCYNVYSCMHIYYLDILWEGYEGYCNSSHIVPPRWMEVRKGIQNDSFHILSMKSATNWWWDGYAWYLVLKSFKTFGVSSYEAARFKEIEKSTANIHFHLGSIPKHVSNGSGWWYVCISPYTLHTITYTLTLLQVDLVFKKSHVAYTTTSGGSLGLPVDEERSKLR